MKREKNIKAICGVCGTNESNPENAYCINGHDHWVELPDFGDHALREWVNSAAQNLCVTRDELWESIYYGVSLY